LQFAVGKRIKRQNYLWLPLSLFIYTAQVTGNPLNEASRKNIAN